MGFQNVSWMEARHKPFKFKDLAVLAVDRSNASYAVQVYVFLECGRLLLLEVSPGRVSRPEAVLALEAMVCPGLLTHLQGRPC